MANQMAEQSPGPYVPGWTFGDKFRKARRISGLDQREFAARVGLTASTVAAYEGDRATPRLRDVGSLAKRIQLLTGIEQSWFMEFEMPSTGPAPTGGGTALHGVGTTIKRDIVGRTGLEPVTDGL